jgi:hypothetical protein
MIASSSKVSLLSSNVALALTSGPALRWPGKAKNICLAIFAGSLLGYASNLVAEEVKIHNIEYPTRLYGDGVVIVTVESSNKKVECIAYKGDFPVGSGSGYTTARIANVNIHISQREGELSVKCS